jgi:5-methylcytosine-specific restriction endonuclease McrA
MRKICLGCGEAKELGLHSRCSQCRKKIRSGKSASEPNPYDRRYRNQRDQVLSQRPLICHICGEGEEAIPRKGPFQTDHVVPLSLGGEPTRPILKPAHRGCNISKGGRNRWRGGAGSVRVR